MLAIVRLGHSDYLSCFHVGQASLVCLVNGPRFLLLEVNDFFLFHLTYKLLLVSHRPLS